MRRGKVRRAKLYYLRGLRGKRARITERQDSRTRKPLPDPGTMLAIATRYKKAGLFGLFLWLTRRRPWCLPAWLRRRRCWSSSRRAGRPAVRASAQKHAATARLQIEKATPIFDERTREPVVAFRLTERSGRMFAEFTANNIGRTIEVRIDGKVVMRPIIREAIKGGSVQVSGGFTLATAKELADRLNSGAARVEAEVVGLGRRIRHFSERL